MRVRRSWCCSRVGAAAAPASSPTSYYKQKTKVYKGSSAMPLLLPKISLWTRHAAPLANKAWEARAEGKFWCGQNLPILPKKEQKD